MSERIRLNYRYKAIEVAPTPEAIEAAIQEWTSAGYEVFESHPAIPPQAVGVIIFRKERRP